MLVDIQTRRLRTIEQLHAFTEGNETVTFQSENGARAYAFIGEILGRFGYPRLGKADKGVVLHFLLTVTGFLRQQLERLVRQRHHPRPSRRQPRPSVLASLHGAGHPPAGGH